MSRRGPLSQLIQCDSAVACLMEHGMAFHIRVQRYLYLSLFVISLQTSEIFLVVLPWLHARSITQVRSSASSYHSYSRSLCYCYSLSSPLEPIVKEVVCVLTAHHVQREADHSLPATFGFLCLILFCFVSSLNLFLVLLCFVFHALITKQKETRKEK